MSKSDEVVVIDQQGGHSSKAGFAIFIAIALFFTLGVGSTFALLSYAGNQTPNRFTVAQELTCDLLEPQFTNAALADNGASSSSTTVSAEDVQYVGADGIAIPKYAARSVPGTYYAKNPFVVNTAYTSNSDDAGSNGFAGIKVQFQKVDSSGDYVNMTNDDDVAKLLACYYIGNEAVTTGTDEEGQTIVSTNTDANTLAGFGDGTNSKLGTNWYQLLNGSYGATTAGKTSNGAMYFIYGKRLANLETLSTQVTENASSDTWGYDATADSTYATTPLFVQVRFIDSATNAQIDEMRKVLDPNKEVSTAGYTPGWRMLISCGIIQSDKASDAVVSGSTVLTDTIWYTNFKNVLDAKQEADSSQHENRVTFATGMRYGSTLGKYIKKTSDTSASVITGTGVPEATDED